MVADRRGIAVLDTDSRVGTSCAESSSVVGFGAADDLLERA